MGFHVDGNLKYWTSKPETPQVFLKSAPIKWLKWLLCSILRGEVYAIQQYSSDRCPDLCQEITDNLEDWKDWVKASAEGNFFLDFGKAYDL